MAAMRDLNQYLQCRSGHWHYVRRVPICYTKWDTRGIIRTALRTTSIEVARSRRDSLCEADEHFWASLEASLDDVDGELKLGSQSKMRARYKAACGRAMARGFVYTPANELAQTPELSDLIERIMQVGNKTKNKQQEAILTCLLMPTKMLCGKFADCLRRSPCCKPTARNTSLSAAALMCGLNRTARAKPCACACLIMTLPTIMIFCACAKCGYAAPPIAAAPI